MITHIDALRAITFEHQIQLKKSIGPAPIVYTQVSQELHRGDARQWANLASPSRPVGQLIVLDIEFHRVPADEHLDGDQQSGNASHG